jgi:putative transposase
MRRKRFTEEQIIAVLQEAATTPIREVCRKHAIAETTFHRWRGKFAGMQVNDAKRLKVLEDENRRLKRLVADQALDIVMLKDVAGRKW